jgi:hypothetical protein
MNPYEIGIIVLGVLLGFWGVSWVIDKVREVNARPKLFELPGERQEKKEGEGGP